MTPNPSSSLSSSLALLRLFAVLSDHDAEKDSETARAHQASLSENEKLKLSTEIRNLLASAEMPIAELGTESNRWFSEDSEAREWLMGVLGVLDQGEASGSTRVLDSNGTELKEGDSVTVIKDLKVKGGSSDLKRGTLIKSIHLTQDPELIECKVDGSVLVLKTIFLKRS